MSVAIAKCYTVAYLISLFFVVRRNQVLISFFRDRPCGCVMFQARFNSCCSPFGSAGEREICPDQVKFTVRKANPIIIIKPSQKVESPLYVFASVTVATYRQAQIQTSVNKAVGMSVSASNKAGNRSK